MKYTYNQVRVNEVGTQKYHCLPLLEVINLNTVELHSGASHYLLYKDSFVYRSIHRLALLDTCQ